MLNSKETCPICNAEIDYMPSFYPSIECPNNHYREYHSNYASEYTVGDKTFCFDDMGYENPAKELHEAIFVACRKWKEKMLEEEILASFEPIEGKNAC